MSEYMKSEDIGLHRDEKTEVFNPATLEKIGEVKVFNKEDVKGAVQAAREAFLGWSALSFKDRASYLYRVRDLILDNREKIIDTICSETGKVRSDALVETLYVSDIIGFYGKRAKKFLRDEKRSTHLIMKTKRVYVSYTPKGVIGIIAPWNFPLMLTLGEAIPALMAGNAVVIKPSEAAPLTALLAQDIRKEARLPEDVLQVVTGYGDTGAALVEEVDMIAFTGSTAIGKKVIESAAKNLTPFTLELGGKDPMIVLKDADLERAANAAVWGGLFNTGQTCISLERIYVEEPAADDFISRVVDKVKTLRQGIDLNCDKDIGSMTLLKQVEIVERHIEDAVRKGARILIGGKRNTALKGYFFEPTVLVDVNHNMDIMKEETFGPVIPIMRVEDEHEAITLANDSRYGLSSSIWTRDKEKAKLLARHIQAGSVCINDCLINYMVPEVPFGGVKESGIGLRHGPEGIRKFCNVQAVLIDIFGKKKELTWFPYNKTVYWLLKKFMNLSFGRGLKRKVFGRGD